MWSYVEKLIRMKGCYKMHHKIKSVSLVLCQSGNQTPLLVKSFGYGSDYIYFGLYLLSKDFWTIFIIKGTLGCQNDHKIELTCVSLLIFVDTAVICLNEVPP